MNDWMISSLSAIIFDIVEVQYCLYSPDPAVKGQEKFYTDYPIITAFNFIYALFPVLQKFAKENYMKKKRNTNENTWLF